MKDTHFYGSRIQTSLVGVFLRGRRGSDVYLYIYMYVYESSVTITAAGDKSLEACLFGTASVIMNVHVLQENSQA